MQVNVWVGAFFVLSGYVAGYTGTEAGAYVASPRIKPEAAYTISRVAGFYPLFILVQLLFAPMFIFADAYYNGPIATALHGFMSATLVQVSAGSCCFGGGGLGSVHGPGGQAPT
jgi:peptidoglycan/LPS O-acetylase OafA/YrhL